MSIKKRETKKDTKRSGVTMMRENKDSVGGSDFPRFDIVFVVVVVVVVNMLML